MAEFHTFRELLTKGIEPSELETKEIASLATFVASRFSRHLTGRAKPIIGLAGRLQQVGGSDLLSARTALRWSEPTAICHQYLFDGLRTGGANATDALALGYLGLIDRMVDYAHVDTYEEDLDQSADIEQGERRSPRRSRPGLFGQSALFKPTSVTTHLSS